MGDDAQAIEKLQKAILELNERLFGVDGTLAEVRASVNVLKAYVSIQMSPDAPLESLKQLALLEKTVAGVVDPNEQEKRQVLEAAAVLRDWIRRCRRAPDS
jgi:hypothetical protein